MAGPERIEWRRGFPARSLATLVWYLVCAALVVTLVDLLFADEPKVLESGASNPLADFPMWTVGIAVFGAAPVILAVARRPRVGANHFALTVRPGWVRTLVLPWSRVAEVAVSEVEGERYLLVRCREGVDRTGTDPHWVDQNVLRAVAKGGHRFARHFDVAVRLRDFVGGSDEQVAALAAFAPDHVLIAPNRPNQS